MASELIRHPAARHTMQRMEDAKRNNAAGDEFWLARDVAKILNYEDFRNFLGVVERARQSLLAEGQNLSHHIVETTTVVRERGGVKERGQEYFLSRGACYLIAMNGDPTKPEVAGAQMYFAIQTRRAELEIGGHAHKRLESRERVRKAAKRVSDVANDKGVKHFALFHNARYEGLYEQSSRQVHLDKGVPENESLLDYAGPLELAAHAFQMELASEKLAADWRSGEDHAIKTNREVGESVRRTMIAEVGHGPEKLALERQPIKELEREHRKLAALSKPKTRS